MLRKLKEQASEKKLSDNDYLVLELRRKHATLTAESHKINNAYSTIISSLTLPFLLEIAFFKMFGINSPFVLSLMSVTRQNNAEIDALIAKLYDLVDNGVKLNMREVIFSNLNEELAPTFYEKFLQASQHPSVQEKLNNVMNNYCDEQWAGLIEKHFGESTPINDIANAVTTYGRGISLAQLQSNHLSHCQQTSVPLIEKYGALSFLRYSLKLMNWNFVKTEFNSSFSMFSVNISAIKVGVVIACKRIFIDRLVQRGVDNGLRPLPKYVEYKNREELLAILKDINDVETRLIKPAKQAETVARCFSLMLFVLLMIEKYLDVRVPQSIWLISLCFAVNGMADLVVSANKYINYERNYKSKLHQNVIDFKAMLDQSYLESVASLDIGSLSESRICIKCKPFKGLSAAFVADIICKTLSRNNFGPIEAHENTLWVSATRQLSGFQARKMKAEISNILTNKVDNRTVKQNRPLDTELWFEEVEHNKSISKRDKRVKLLAEYKLVANPNNNNNDAVPAPPRWTTANADQASPIINSRRHNQFTLFKLNQDDFPNKKSYEKFKDTITDAPQIVRPVGAQGLVYSNKFGGTLKAKVLGEYGNFRVYATQKEVTAAGETLYVFDRLDSKAH